MNASKTPRAATAKTLKDLPAEKPEVVKGGFVIYGRTGTVQDPDYRTGYVQDPDFKTTG